MDKESVMMRLLASQAKINMGDIRTGRIVDSAWPRLINAAAVMSDSQLFIDDTSGISPFEIRAKARRLKAQHGVDCIMVDYLQIMDLKQKVESRERQVSEISRLLKSIARELNVPVIALSQLNRSVEGRNDRRPMLSDLRESGSIEQDADVIMMLYREGYYDKDTPEAQTQAEVIIGKQRNGPTGNVKLSWRAQYGVFEDYRPSDGAPLPGSGLPPPSAPPTNGPRGSGKPLNFAPRK
jgi:replicative DNA helicase